MWVRSNFREGCRVVGKTSEAQLSNLIHWALKHRIILISKFVWRRWCDLTSIAFYLTKSSGTSEVGRTELSQMPLHLEYAPWEHVNDSGHLHTPTDVRLANKLFEANCGPACLAAILSVQVCDVMCLFEHFPTRPFTSRRKMEEILHSLNIPFSRTQNLPRFGLALIQFEGPWSQISGSEKWTSRYTHWVAVSNGTIYEVNAERWLTQAEWSIATERLLVHYPRATGWRIKEGLEVAAQAFVPESALPGYAFGLA